MRLKPRLNAPRRNPSAWVSILHQRNIMSKLHLAGAAMGALALVCVALLLWNIGHALPLGLTLLAIVGLGVSLEQVVLARRTLRSRRRNQQTCDQNDCPAQ
jgi:uncharacterized integral membrane protein